MAFRQWLPLIGLTVSVFIFNMSEFMPVGLLTSIADDFGTSESQTGLIISFYAWAVAICSLPLMLLLRKVDYRPMLLMAVLTFTVFQFLSGISTSYWMLMASRIGVALAHSVFWSIAAPLAVSVVEFRYHRFALSVMAVGTSVAMILGLPLGRVIGLAMGWRMSFFAIAAVS
ncbi:MAG: MFS transporter, partial [Candidatus Methanomethylophilus sp.]|nr:MFS transporter [Methanomethylophilus sp.]